MKKLIMFTDPHLGTKRAAHTTKASSKRLQDALFDTALTIVNTANSLNIPALCNGDLFDKAFNDEDIIVQGHNVASRCRITLSGNHDEINRVGQLTSLQALRDMGVPVCAAPNLHEPYFDFFEGVYMVPHHASNDLFLTACTMAAQHAEVNRSGQASYLFIHCNYDFPMALEDNTLNLPMEAASRLVESFDYIFIGHEHKPSEHMMGQVVVMGNTHPTSFSDISDKYVYELDLETATLTRDIVWRMDDHFLELEMGAPIPNLDNIQFIDVVGSAPVENGNVVSQYINDIWKAATRKDGSCDLFAVRPKVQIIGSLEGVDADFDSAGLENIEARVEKDLAGTDLLDIFKSLVAEVKQ